MFYPASSELVARCRSFETSVFSRYCSFEPTTECDSLRVCSLKMERLLWWSGIEQHFAHVKWRWMPLADKKVSQKICIPDLSWTSENGGQSTRLNSNGDREHNRREYSKFHKMCAQTQRNAHIRKSAYCAGKLCQMKSPPEVVCTSCSRSVSWDPFWSWAPSIKYSTQCLIPPFCSSCNALITSVVCVWCPQLRLQQGEECSRSFSNTSSVASFDRLLPYS